MQILHILLGCFHRSSCPSWVPFFRQSLSPCRGVQGLYPEFSLFLESSPGDIESLPGLFLLCTHWMQYSLILSLLDNFSSMKLESGSIKGKASSLLSGSNQGLQQTSLSLMHSSQSLSPSKLYGFSISPALLFIPWKNLRVWDWCPNNQVFLFCTV